LISIIIPLYNSERYIKETLDSVLDLSIKEIEIIIVNDGSTDSSISIVNEYLGKHNNISLISKKNTGVANSRNIGLQKAKGEYVLFLDADDVLNSSFFDLKMDLINSKSNIIGSYIQVFENNIENVIGYNHSVYQDPIKSILKFENGVTLPSSYLFKRSFLIENNISFNTNLSSTADRFFLIQCALKDSNFKIETQNPGTLFYRVSEKSMSHNFNKKLIDDNARYVLELIKLEGIKQKLYLMKNVMSVLKSYIKLGKEYMATVLNF